MDNIIQITAEIRNIRYRPTLCSPLDTIPIEDFPPALAFHASFFLNIDRHNTFAISRWVSPKRTRSYPYGRVYDTLQYSGKKVTIIPIFKDEGIYGDRDYLQWDTVSLMSLLGVYTIIGFYDRAVPNYRNRNKPKITYQQFNPDHIYDNLMNLLDYQSDPLHWNLDQLNRVGEVGDYAIAAYQGIQRELDIPMHSVSGAQTRIDMLRIDAETFKRASRRLAATAASRETISLNPKENVSGSKGRITITNYLGGEYNLTSDEVWFVDDNTIQLVEAKHTTDPGKLITSDSDIKDAVVKMILFTNLENIRVAGKAYRHQSVMKLTSQRPFSPELLTGSKRELYLALQEEAVINNFSIIHK